MASKRGWLNEDYGLGAYQWTVEPVEYMGRGEDKQFYMDAGFEITDCSRKVSLDFDVYGDNEQFYKMLDKVDILISALGDFKCAMAEEYAKREAIKAKSLIEEKDEESVQEE